MIDVEKISLNEKPRLDFLETSNKALKFPDELYYSANHLWISVDENLLTLGVTHLIPDKLGEILYFDAPDVGDRVTKDISFGSLESVTDWITLISPMCGLIVELNDELVEQPYILNDDPYLSAWILKVEIESEKELVELMRVPEYKLIKSR